MALVESFSGIRGIIDKELTDSVALRYAYAYASFLKDKTKDPVVVIGRDSRISGEKLRDLLIEGLDTHVVDVGILPTPTIENAVRKCKADGGIIITASHNEPNFNGFKFLNNKGIVLKEKNIQKVIDFHKEISKLTEEEFLDNELYRLNKIKRIKKVSKEHISAKEDYKKFLKKFFTKYDLKLIKESKTKILVDPNGGAGTISKEIFDGFEINAEYINTKTSEFKRTVEPNERSLKPLVKIIKDHGCEFAAGFDCDADRVEIILKDGTLVSGNHILALITKDILESTKKTETIVTNDATSYLVKDIVESCNANYKEVEVGEVNVVNTMVDYNSPVGGEGSNGGVIIPPSTCRDGILTIIYLMKIIAKNKRTLKELIEELPEYYYEKQKIKLKKDFVKEGLKKHYLDNGFKIEETGDETGGLKAIKDNSWIWFRQSKTEDKVLRIIVDSKDDKIAKDLLKEGKKLAI